MWYVACCVVFVCRYEDKNGALNAFAQLSNVSLQAAVMEILIAHYDQIFTDDNEQEPNLLGKR